MNTKMAMQQEVARSGQKWQEVARSSISLNVNNMILTNMYIYIYTNLYLFSKKKKVHLKPQNSYVCGSSSYLKLVLLLLQHQQQHMHIYQY